MSHTKKHVKSAKNSEIVMPTITESKKYATQIL